MDCIIWKGMGRTGSSLAAEEVQNLQFTNVGIQSIDDIPSWCFVEWSSKTCLSVWTVDGGLRMETALLGDFLKDAVKIKTCTPNLHHLVIFGAGRDVFSYFPYGKHLDVEIMKLEYFDNALSVGLEGFARALAAAATIPFETVRLWGNRVADDLEFESVVKKSMIREVCSRLEVKLVLEFKRVSAKPGPTTTLLYPQNLID
jgi:hypothetical protein